MEEGLRTLEALLDCSVWTTDRIDELLPPAEELTVSFRDDAAAEVAEGPGS